MHAAQLSGKRVLVVDDSKFVRTTFRNILSKTFTVLEEADGEAGWRTLSSDPGIVIVFTDLDMPRLDGFGLLARIRGSRDARVRTLPVAIITGDEQAATKRRAREAGASSFISKSADGPEVLTRIDRLMKMVRPPATAPARQDLFTGVLSARGLISEGERHYTSARRHGTELSVLALRIDSHAELARREGAELADQLLGQIARVVLGALRSGDALGRTAIDTFVLLAPGAAAPQIAAVAGRLREQLGSAQVAYRGRTLGIACSFGIASAATDGAARTAEDLIHFALQRLKPAPRPRPGLGDELERSLRTLERAAPSEELLNRIAAIAKALKARQQ
jgi:diguanylate cyclase (GGDEF)-like protein